MRKHLFLLALAVACGSNHHGDDDDSSGGESGETSTGGSAGKARGGRAGGTSVGGVAGTSTAHAGAAGTSGGVSAGMPGAGGSSGATQGGSSGAQSSSSGGQGARSGDAGAGGEEPGGMSGIGGEAGEGISNGGDSGTSGTGGSTGGTGGTTGGTGGTTGGTGGTTGGTGGTTGGTGGGGGTAGSTGGTAGAGGAGAGGMAGSGATFSYSGAGGQTSGAGQPVVELLVDGSSSMFEDPSWNAMMTSLITDGVLAAFEGQLNLGLGLYQGKLATSEADPACATWATRAFAGQNAGEIGNDLISVGNTWAYQKWETPTGHAVGVAAQTLDAYAVSPGVKKYILLITDGAPNTCQVVDPQCGQDTAIKAVQDARALGIRTLIVGLGDIISGNDGCAPSGHCGDAHLQDIANAGVGYPVEPLAAGYRYETCVQNQTLLATYASTGGGGSATFYSAKKTGGLTGQLTAALQAIVNDSVP